jgi:hypothetical protein
MIDHRRRAAKAARRRRTLRERAAAWDTAALAVLCDALAGPVRVGGELLMALRPKGGEWPQDVTSWDRRVCAAGVRAFVRPSCPHPWPAGEGGLGGRWTLVEEIRPGLRVRRGIEVCWPDDN